MQTEDREHAKNGTKRDVHSDKYDDIYIFDSGICRAILKYSTITLPKSTTDIVHNPAIDLNKILGIRRFFP